LFICISFYKKPKEEANIVPSLTQGKISIPEPIPISENKSFGGDTRKSCYSGRSRTISAHKDANN
jgi:hypothetical protein